MKDIFDIIAENCDSNIVKKKRDIDLFETGLIDSMGFISMLVEIEEEYGIEFPPEIVQKDVLNTPNKIAEYVKRKLL